jgi:signal transduction histidine kinase
VSGFFWLDWPALALSLFNTILLIWLSLIVLLNAEKRSAGLWVAGGELLLGGVFFLSHSILLGHGPGLFSQRLDFWWRLGSIPLASLPIAWYGIIIWYSGYWEQPGSALHHKHRIWLWLAIFLATLVIGWLIIANPLPTFQRSGEPPYDSGEIGVGLLPLSVLFSLYILLCTALSIDALLRPAPSGRLMGDAARQRARGWLVAVSTLLLLVGMLVAWVIAWIIRQPVASLLGLQTLHTIARFDLVIAALISLAVLLIGQAIVSYEIFTGRTLPQHGLRQYWWRAIVLAAGYGMVVAWGMVMALQPVYLLMLSTILMTIFFALLAWRAFLERQAALARLRPFIASQGLYEQLAQTSLEAASAHDAKPAFIALCRDLLGCQQAALLSLGPASSLAGQPLVFPSGLQAALPVVSPQLSHLPSLGLLCLPLDAQQHNGFAWLIPLWSGRGLIGYLLLGDKRDGSLYAQEEMEIARSVAERLLDAQVSAELARRLMALQRQRMAETVMVDQRTRRTLHDDVLPRLHAIILELSAAQSEQSGGSVAALGEVHCQIAGVLRELPRSSSNDLERLGLIGALLHVVESELSQAFDSVEWLIENGLEEKVRQLPALAGETIYYAAREALRNAARHARPAGGKLSLGLKVQAAWQEGLHLAIEDNGVGLNEISKSQENGGQGLALHSTLMAVVGGSLEVESASGEFTRVSLKLPQ